MIIPKILEDPVNNQINLWSKQNLMALNKIILNT